MAIKHSDLTGADLHGARVTLEGPDRVPAWAGELVFDGADLWVANGTLQTDWKKASTVPPPPPLRFGWMLNTTTFSPGNRTVERISLFYKAVTQADAALNPDSFTQLQSWAIGTDLGIGSPIDLAPFVQSKGRGVYVVLLTGEDSYGTADQPMSGVSLAISAANPNSALSVFQLFANFVGYGGENYQDPFAFEVLTPYAEVLINLTNL